MLTLFKRKPQKAICYNICKEVVMTAFIKAMVSQDYSGLVKSGNPCKEELENAWNAIFNEYLVISGDTHIQQLLILLKRIAFLTNRLQLIELLVSQVADKYDETFCMQLRKMGFRFEYENGPQLRRELELTITQAKMQLVELDQMQRELQQLRKSQGDSVSEMDYELQMSELSKFQGYYLDPDKVTVTQYCAILKRFKDFYKPRE